MRVCSASTAACSPTRRSVLDVSSLLSADAVIVAWGQSATIVAMPLRVRYKKNLIIDIFIKNKLIFWCLNAFRNVHALWLYACRRANASTRCHKRKAH